MKVIIVEEDFIVADHFKMILEKHGVTVLEVVDSAEEAIANIEPDADLYFVDIRLRGKLTGLDLAVELRKKGINFIYVTANNEIATVKKATQTLPNGYITKPYKESDIVAMLEIYKAENAQVMEIRTKHGKKQIKLSDILYLEADGSYVKVVTLKEEYIEIGTLTEIEEEYNSYFTRVHRSFLVNTDKIEEYNSKEVYIHGKAIPISRSYKDLLTKTNN
ncbi:MAG: DNA-binding LytR/AlgR family response regulator [Vicingaceae bacterium]|jgi:DNA-binding LytR/AlgR family response regulator